MELVGKKILIVDDEPLFLQTTCQLLRNEGADCSTAVDAPSALVELEKKSAEAREFDLVLTDLNMPGNLRWELLQAGRHRWSHVPMIVITGVPSLPSAIESLRLGVTDYLLKPVAFPELLTSVRRALANAVSRPDSAQTVVLSEGRRPADYEEIIGSSDAMLSVLAVIGRVARSSAHVLISGETGTGKELVARTIHRQSSRSDRKFVVVDCNAVVEQQLTADLFGMVLSDRSVESGLLAEADRGTLFLDEITALPLTFQPKLLRVVQHQEMVPVGSKTPQGIDVRFISATQGNLEDCIAGGTFRQDLYYRLGVLSLELPPLRQRGEDVIELAEHFWRLSVPEKNASLQLTPSARELLLAYQWPGNVRELKNVIQRSAMLASSDVLDVCDLPAEMERSVDQGRTMQPVQRGTTSIRAGHTPENSSEASDATFHARRAETERTYLLQLMESSRGNVTHAARKANMSRQGIHKLLKRHGMSAADFRETDNP
ncbi:MAG TPA: sigma-54-dependent Fis family transcriptional regulator [Planctomycetaceae bacterium]|nr:sigma-54-dependent Fis family transcriptional regulator [Planctomycetaceae bacterium]